MKLLLVLNRAFHDPTRGSGQDVKKNIAGPVGSGRSGGVRNFQEISREISRVRLSLFQEFFLVGSGLGSGLEVFPIFQDFSQVGSGRVWSGGARTFQEISQVGSGRVGTGGFQTSRIGLGLTRTQPEPRKALVLNTKNVID